MQSRGELPPLIFKPFAELTVEIPGLCIAAPFTTPTYSTISSLLPESCPPISTEKERSNVCARFQRIFVEKEWVLTLLIFGKMF